MERPGNRPHSMSKNTLIEAGGCATVKVMPRPFRDAKLMDNEDYFFRGIDRRMNAELNHYMKENIDNDCINCSHRKTEKSEEYHHFKDERVVRLDTKCRLRVCEKRLSHYEITGMNVESIRLIPYRKDDLELVLSQIEIKNEDLGLW